MNNLSEILGQRLNSSLQLQCVVRANSIDQFSDLIIRSSESDLMYPQGWQIGIETIASKIFMEFAFDDSARILNNFYENRLREVSELFWSTHDVMVSEGYEVQVFSGSREVQAIDDFRSDSKVTIKCSFKSNLSDAELVSNVTEFITPVMRFTSFCLIPLLPDSDVEEEINEEVGLPEGALSKVLVNKYERNPKNRNACLAYYGSKCVACDFDFGLMYGDFASNYIHVHHTTPISELGANYVINPIRDLVPLCPNCHAAVHLVSPPISPKALKEMINKRGEIN